MNDLIMEKLLIMIKCLVLAMVLVMLFMGRFISTPTVVLIIIVTMIMTEHRIQATLETLGRRPDPKKAFGCSQSDI